jgi:succinate-semialdehyde dehydrogenase/glutarate-semialdehyde dehydrogenase
MSRRPPIPVRNPRTGLADHAIVPLDADEVKADAARLRQAQRAWAALDPEERSERLRALAGAIAARRDALQAALEADTGRRGVTALEIDSVLRMIGRWADRAPGLVAEVAVADAPTAMPGVTYGIVPDPVPLVGVISPWNFPLLLALTDAIPALAAGCAVLVKPSEVTPRFVRPLMEAVDAVADVPLALIDGDGETGAALVGAVDFVCFTGSVATGRKVGEAAARAFIPASLELGGKDPMIILDSADPEWAAEVALSASCRATGQACQSIERIYVAAPLFDAFVAALVRAVEAVTLDAPEMGDGDLGPFIFEGQARVVAGQIADAVALGARICAGGTVETLGGGLYMRPTVLTDVTHEMAVMRHETFGPVMPVMPFADVDEAVRLANDSDHGLSAAVLAGTIAEAESVAVRLDAGAVSLNDGALTALVSDAEKSAWKLSGLGPSRMGASGLTRFLKRRAILRQTGAALPLAAFSGRSR